MGVDEAWDHRHSPRVNDFIGPLTPPGAAGPDFYNLATLYEYRTTFDDPLPGVHGHNYAVFD